MSNGDGAPPVVAVIQEDTNNLRGKYTVEREDDRGHLQQISGGFGDSTALDEETILKLLQQQQARYPSCFLSRICIVCRRQHRIRSSGRSRMQKG